jgi:U3 small nucleolar RNA-associated protein 7
VIMDPKPQQKELQSHHSTRKRKSSDVDKKRQVPPLKRRKLSNERHSNRKREILYRKKLLISSKKYQRGTSIIYHNIQNKKLRAQLRLGEKLIKEAATEAARAEILLPEEPGMLEATEPLEATWKFKQRDIKAAVNIGAAAKVLDLRLEKLGPYTFDYSRNGRYLLLGGERGHVALLDWHKNKLMTELFLNETVRDVKFLHNETMFAVAQKKYVFFYDKQGIELHKLEHHVQPLRLEFLPYHFLLVSCSKMGVLCYQDISTGAIVAEHRTGMGPCCTLRQNPANAIIHLGHTHGIVTFWSPNIGKPLVKMLCHKGPVNALGIDREGKYLVTAGLDRRLKVWDLRTYRELQTYLLNKTVTSLDISQLGLLATAYGPHIQVWKNYVWTQAESLYMTHDLPKGGTINDVHFCPFEDLLGISYSEGFTTMIVPGAGEPNFDTFEANPFETKKQRRENTVVKLLEKIPSTMITLNQNIIGSVTTSTREQYLEDKKIEFEANTGQKFEPTKKTKKARGKETASKREAKKQSGIIENARARKQEENRRRLLEKRQRQQQQQQIESTPKIPKSALDRFERPKYR